MGHHLRGLLIVGCCMFVTACASSGGMVYTPRPFPQPGGWGGTTVAPAPAPADPTGTVAANPPVVPPTGVPPSAAPPPSTRPGPLARPGQGNADGYALSGTALSLRGAPYRMGGVSPDGFDCSGFVSYVYQQHGVAMPREVRDQFKVGKQIDRDQLEPGDLVFFSTVAPGASHVGIVIGGDQFVHAPSERGVVRVESLSQQYWASRFIGAKRVS
jgi:cell wall-associated NlpC family hydrolase